MQPTEALTTMSFANFLRETDAVGLFVFGLLVLMSIELILNAVNLNFVAFALRNGSADGHTFALYIIAIAAAEVAVGLGLVLLIFRNRRTISLDDLSEMKG